MDRTLIAPSLLSADFARLGEEIRAVEAGGADWLHFDVMDGHFVPNISVGPVVLEGVARVAQIPVDVHLMVREPAHLIEAFVAAGADLLTVHVEACTHLDRTLRRIRELGARPGVSLNPATPWTAVEPVLDLVDLVLVMSVNPGFGGQSFIASSLEKVARLREALDARGSAAHLQMDGGITPRNAAGAAAAGADVLVAGSAVFRAQDYGDAIRGIRAAADGARPPR
ncbi:MAG: ribulose-phosphate 3-epimerase [Pseudomonadota bacterium]